MTTSPRVKTRIEGECCVQFAITAMWHGCGHAAAPLLLGLKEAKGVIPVGWYHGYMKQLRGMTVTARWAPIKL